MIIGTLLWLRRAHGLRHQLIERGGEVGGQRPIRRRVGVEAVLGELHHLVDLSHVL